MLTIFKRTLGALLLILALGLFLWPFIREVRTSSQVSSIAEELIEGQENLPEADPGTETDPGTEPSPEIQLPSQETGSSLPLLDLYGEFWAYNRSLVSDGQVITDAWAGSPEAPDISGLDDGLLGYIEIPDMGVSLPLYVGASYDHLSKGAAIQWGTSMPIGGENTNSVIVAHRGWYGSAYFAYINQMETGSKVYIHTPWDTLTYSAVSKKIITPEDLDSVSIQPGKDMVTLLSCYPYAAVGGAKYRYLVYCERTADDPEVVEESGNTEETGTPLPTVEDSIPEVEADPKGTDGTVTFLELSVARYLPAVTVLLCAVILFIRSRRSASS